MKEFIENLKDRYCGNHILGDGSVLEPDKWEELDHPYVWYKVTGEIFLGKCFVLLRNYIGISECFTGGDPKLYKEVSHER